MITITINHNGVIRLFQYKPPISIRFSGKYICVSGTPNIDDSISEELLTLVSAIVHDTFYTKDVQSIRGE
jgi:uncharacterized protein (DUF2126 family)